MTTPESYSLQVVDILIEENLLRQLAAQEGVVVGEGGVHARSAANRGCKATSGPIAHAHAPTTTTITNTVTTETPLTAETFQQRYQETVEALRGSKQPPARPSFAESRTAELARERLQTVVRYVHRHRAADQGPPSSGQHHP